MPKIIENPYDGILEHARNILYTEGYENLSIRNVAKSCGISVGTIYNYFPTKKDLIRHMVLEYWEEYLHFLDKVHKGQEDLFEKIKQSYLRLESDVSTFKEIWIKIFMDNGHHDIHAEVEKRKEFIDRLIRKFEIIIQGEINKHSGGLNMPLNSYEISKFIVQNFMMMSINRQFEYASFEIILRKLFK